MVRKHSNRKPNANEVKNAAAKRAAGSGNSAGTKAKSATAATTTIRAIPPECKDLELFGRHEDVTGPDAELVDFKLTRQELMSLGYHYLDRFFSVERLYALMQYGTADRVEKVYTAKRFCSIEKVLSPDAPMKEFQLYIDCQRLGIDQLCREVSFRRYGHNALSDDAGANTSRKKSIITPKPISTLPRDKRIRSRCDRTKTRIPPEFDDLTGDADWYRENELVDFPPTRRELKLVVRDYMVRYCNEIVWCEFAGVTDWGLRELTVTSRRIESIERALRPDKVVLEFNQYLRCQQAGIDELERRLFPDTTRQRGRHESTADETDMCPFNIVQNFSTQIEGQAMIRLASRGEAAANKDLAHLRSERRRRQPKTHQ
jgi:hypothetical protein